MPELTKRELTQKIKSMGDITEEQRNRIVCTLIGHSRIQTCCFGYFHCSRCGALLGDNLAGSYDAAPEVVIVGHNCAMCRANYETLTWKDKLYAPNPFPNKDEVVNHG